MDVREQGGDAAADAHWMGMALQEARLAAQRGEVPVGAVVVAPDGKTLLGRGGNACIQGPDPSAHAEVQALREAARQFGNYRLEGCTLYVTLEPCAMCSGAMLHARLAEVVYAVADPRTGAAGSVVNLFAQEALNHQTRVRLLGADEVPMPETLRKVQQECAAVLRAFFRERRERSAMRRDDPEHAPLREDAVRLPRQVCATSPLWNPETSHWALVPCVLGAKAPAWRLHYHDSAPGDTTRPSVVLLHGYAAQAAQWQPWIAALHATGWRVLAPDLPGHGLSDKPKKTAQHSLQGQLDLLMQWWEQLTPAAGMAPALIVSHDSAAMLAARWVRQSGQSRQSGQGEADAHERGPVWQALDPVWGDAWETLSRQPARAWRLACARKSSFDPGRHWAGSMHGESREVWTLPWPDAGHRAAWRWSAWSAVLPPAPQDAAFLDVEAHSDAVSGQGDACPALAEGLEPGCCGAALLAWLARHAQDHAQALAPLMAQLRAQQTQGP